MLCVQEEKDYAYDVWFHRFFIRLWSIFSNEHGVHARFHACSSCLEEIEETRGKALDRSLFDRPYPRRTKVRRESM